MTMAFDVDAGAYDRFMGRYSGPLVAQMIQLLQPEPTDAVLDVGCGTGALTGELVTLLSARQVAAVDPSATFVDAVRARWPGVDVQQASAEALPFADDAFDHSVAQLVVHFMKDPVAGLGEMARVTKPGGSIAACVWDFAGGRSPLSVFWRSAAALDESVPEESRRTGAREGQLSELFWRVGLSGVTPATLRVRVECDSFDDWWEPFTLGVGPAGEYLKTLDRQRMTTLRQRCQEWLPSGPFAVEAVAWAAVGRVASS